MDVGTFGILGEVAQELVVVAEQNRDLGIVYTQGIMVDHV